MGNYHSKVLYFMSSQRTGFIAYNTEEQGIHCNIMHISRIQTKQSSLMKYIQWSVRPVLVIMRQKIKYY